MLFYYIFILILYFIMYAVVLLLFSFQSHYTYFKKSVNVLFSTLTFISKWILALPVSNQQNSTFMKPLIGAKNVIIIIQVLYLPHSNLEILHTACCHFKGLSMAEQLVRAKPFHKIIKRSVFLQYLLQKCPLSWPVSFTCTFSPLVFSFF